MSGFAELLLVQEGLVSVIRQLDELEKKQPALKSALESAVDLKLEKIKQRVADVETEKGRVVERVSLVSDELRRTAGEIKTHTEKLKAQLLAKVAFEAQARESSLRELKEQAEQIARKVTRSMIDDFAARQAAEMEAALAIEAERAPNAADFNNLSQNWASLYVGNYEPEKQLRRGDIFTFYGGTYLCLIDSIGVHPSMNEIRGENPRFAILAAPGAPGQAGPTGENSTVAGPAGPAGPTGPAGESASIDTSRTENLLVTLSRIVRLLESSAVVDQQQRQRVSLDAIPAGVTLPTVTTVGTVTTVSTLTNATAIAGMDREQYINIANNTYAQSIRQRLTFV